MSEWKEITIGNLITLQRGHDLVQTEFVKGDYLVAGSNGPIGYHNKFTTKGPGLTIGRSGNSIGEAHFYENNFWAHNTVLYSKEFHNTYPKFVYYLFKAFDFKSFDGGSAVPTLNRNHINPIIIKVPSKISEQKLISSILSSFDDKIDLLHRQNVTLEAMAETLFRQWFVEEAKDDWGRDFVGNVITVKGGTTPSTKYNLFWDGDIFWTTPKDLTNHKGIYLIDTERKITKEGLGQIGSGLLPIGTVLLSSRAPIGYLAITDINVAINQGYIAIICDKGLSNYFMFLWCKTNMDEIQNAGNGSVFQEISKSVFKELPIILPPKSIHDDFNRLVEPIFQRIRINKLQSRNLNTLRDTLLPKLMSGEVRVAE